MARDHARLLTDIWNDPDFRRLTVAEQHAYIVMFSQKRLSWCGVLDFVPGRLSVLASDWTEAKVKRAVTGLDRARYVLLDAATQEALVRTFVRHDRVLIRTNMGKAVGSAFHAITSDRLRSAVTDELAREFSANPRHAGWTGLQDTAPSLFESVTERSSTIPLPVAIGNR